MDSSTKPLTFRSRLYPDVAVTLNRATYRTRRIVDELAAKNGSAGDPIGLAFRAYVRDFDGITLDGEKPTVEGLLLDGPGDLIGEIIDEIGRISARPSAGDEALRDDLRQQLADVEERIERSKNSGPATSPATTDAGTLTAGDASATAPRPSESGESATVTASHA